MRFDNVADYPDERGTRHEAMPRGFTGDLIVAVRQRAATPPRLCLDLGCASASLDPLQAADLRSICDDYIKGVPV